MLEKAQVRMIRTDSAKVGTILLVGDGWGHPSHLVINENSKFDEDVQKLGGLSESRYEPHHLYFTRKEDIHPGEWYLYRLKEWELMQCVDEAEAKRCNSNTQIGWSSQKIVATTNPELWYTKQEAFGTPLKTTKDSIPKIGLDFVKAYVREQGKIKEVMLEYVYICPNGHIMGVSRSCSYPHCGRYADKQFYVRSNGTVIIHPIKDRMIPYSSVMEFLDFAIVPDGNPILIKDKLEAWYDKNYPSSK